MSEEKVGVLKFVNYSKRIVQIAVGYGWMPGACYTNIRNVREFDKLGFLDVNWKRYDFKAHLEAAKVTRPMLTVAKDIEDIKELPLILEQAYQLLEYAERVIVVPKDEAFNESLDEAIPPEFILGYSVPTRYGGTTISTKCFNRPVHLLGGRPDVQRRLADKMPVISLDCNRFALDANYGDYFDGDIFRPHPLGGYDTCVHDSLMNINRIWENYPLPRC